MAKNTIKAVMMLVVFASLGVDPSVANAGTAYCYKGKAKYGEVGYSVKNAGTSKAYLNMELRPEQGHCIKMNYQIDGIWVKGLGVVVKAQSGTRSLCNGSRQVLKPSYPNNKVGYSVTCSGYDEISKQLGK
jgi:hypothetical protein